MSKPVLFVTGLGNKLERAENLKALYDTYQGEKAFIPVSSPDYYQTITSNKYNLRIVDTFPTEHHILTIMMWHAIQGGKHIGLNEKTTYYRKEYANCIDYIVAASDDSKQMWNQCTAVSTDKILSLGMPRTDRYIGKIKGDGKTILANKRSYLYVPTFRAHGEPAIPPIDWEWLDEHLSDDELLIIKSHPQGKSFLGRTYYKHIIEADKMEPSVNYLYDCDIVITDYSSIIFDGYLLNKPSVLFEKKTGYPEYRGMYMQYPKEYSSKYATNEKELLEILRSTNTLTNTEQDCLQKVANMCDGHSSERICKLIDKLR